METNRRSIALRRTGVTNKPVLRPRSTRKAALRARARVAKIIKTKEWQRLCATEDKLDKRDTDFVPTHSADSSGGDSSGGDSGGDSDSSGSYSSGSYSSGSDSSYSSG